MSNTSTIHLQRSIHFNQCISLFRKFVYHFDASYGDYEPLFEPELTDLHCSDKLDLNSNKMMCLLLQLFPYDISKKAAKDYCMLKLFWMQFSLDMLQICSAGSMGIYFSQF